MPDRRRRRRPLGRRARQEVEDEELETDDDDVGFTSHMWPAFLARRPTWQRCAAGLSFAVVNGVLLAHNVGLVSSKGASSSLPPAPPLPQRAPPRALPLLEVPTLKPLESTVSPVEKRVAALLGQSPDEIAQKYRPRMAGRSNPKLRGNTGPKRVVPSPVPVVVGDLHEANKLVAFVLKGEEAKTVSFQTPSWFIPKSPLMGQELPYAKHYQEVNWTHGEYLGQQHGVYFSPCSARLLEQQDVQFGDTFFEKGTIIRMNCSEREKAANLAAKRVVVYLNMRESGYFGHAIDNVFPRIVAILGGAAEAGKRISLVLPPTGKMSMSRNTEIICEALGIELLQRVPRGPHQTLGVSGVGTWDKQLRQGLQRAVWSSTLLRGRDPASCSKRCPPAHSQQRGRCNCAAGGIFLARRSGTRNSRLVEGGELLEEAFHSRGFEVLEDAAAVPLAELAVRLYGICCLAGYSGTAMSNLIFLPPGATVIEFNPHLKYANAWQWSHALGYEYYEFQPAKKLNASEAERWARLALGE